MRLFTILATIALSALLLSSAAPAQSVGCPIRPMKPMVPMGCKDLQAVCHCDARGQNCWWEWVCVR